MIPLWNRDPRRKTGKNRNVTSFPTVYVTPIPVARRGRIETHDASSVGSSRSIPVARRGRIETIKAKIVYMLEGSPSQDGEE